jgi:hypothetical protein
MFLCNSSDNRCESMKQDTAVVCFKRIVKFTKTTACVPHLTARHDRKAPGDVLGVCIQQLVFME